MFLLLRKDVCPYQYKDNLEKFNHSLLPPEKEGFYSHLNTEDITDADYTLAKTVCEDFIKIYELEIYACFLTAPGLALQATLRKTKI